MWDKNIHVQGDTSGCSPGFVVIKAKAAFQYKELKLERIFCFDVNLTLDGNNLVCHDCHPVVCAFTCTNTQRWHYLYDQQTIPSVEIYNYGPIITFLLPIPLYPDQSS